MSTNDKLARLRDLIYGEPTEKTWLKIVMLFESWQGSDLEVAVNYAADHLRTWSDELRIAPDRWWHPNSTKEPLSDQEWNRYKVFLDKLACYRLMPVGTGLEYPPDNVTSEEWRQRWPEVVFQPLALMREGYDQLLLVDLDFSMRELREHSRILEAASLEVFRIFGGLDHIVDWGISNPPPLWNEETRYIAFVKSLPILNRDACKCLEDHGEPLNLQEALYYLLQFPHLRNLANKPLVAAGTTMQTAGGRSLWPSVGAWEEDESQPLYLSVFYSRLKEVWGEDSDSAPQFLFRHPCVVPVK